MTNTTATQYRIFVLPGHGRVRAPAHMTQAQLQAALLTQTDTAEDENATPQG